MKTAVSVLLLQALALLVLNVATSHGEMKDYMGRENELGLSNHNPGHESSSGPCSLCVKCRTFAATVTGVLADPVARVCDRVHCHNCANQLVGGDVELTSEQHCEMCMKCDTMAKSMAGTMLAGDISGLCYYIHCKNCADTLVASVSNAEGDDPCGMCQVCGMLNDQVENTPIGPSFVSTCFYNHCYGCAKKLVANFMD